MSNDIANVTVDELVFGEKAAENLQRALGWCTAVQRSGMLPTHIKTPQQALVTMLKGKELGLSPIVALESIYVIKGKSEIPGIIMESLLRKGGVDIEVKHWDGQRCELLLHRKGFTSFPAVFTIEQAKAAGLLSNQNYKSYPEDMLYWRALSRGARRIGADLIKGCYVEGEIRHTIREVEAEIVCDPQPTTPRASKPSKMDSLAGKIVGKTLDGEKVVIDQEDIPYDIDPDTGEIVPNTLPGMDGADDFDDPPFEH